MRARTTFIGSTILAMALAVGGATAASATVTAAPAGEGGGAVALAASVLDPRLADTTDLDLLLLLLTGRGPVADAHPELIDELGISPMAEGEDPAEVVPIAERFLIEYPAFSTTWAPAIRSADPATRSTGIDGFMGDFVDFVGRFCRPSCSV